MTLRHTGPLRPGNYNTQRDFGQMGLAQGPDFAPDIRKILPSLTSREGGRGAAGPITTVARAWPGVGCGLGLVAWGWFAGCHGCAVCSRACCGTRHGCWTAQPWHPAKPQPARQDGGRAAPCAAVLVAARGTVAGQRNRGTRPIRTPNSAIAVSVIESCPPIGGKKATKSVQKPTKSVIVRAQSVKKRSKNDTVCLAHLHILEGRRPWR